MNRSIRDFVLKFLWISVFLVALCFDEQTGSLHFLYFEAFDCAPGFTRLLIIV